MRVRRAKPQDRKLFLKLYEEHLEEVKETPGSFLPTEENLETLGVLFDTYTSGELQGVVLMVAQDAIGLFGEIGSQPFETNLGKTVIGWAVYVRESARGKGVSQAIYKRAKRLLREMGFDYMIGEADIERGGGRRACEKAGFKASSMILHLDLREEE
jgi:GNAT superfamily N-acetyltransferase